jgi:transcriptional regulator with XRE-family HTH domain
MERTIYSAEHLYLVQLLREARADANVTQVDLAELLHRPQSFVSKYESGQRRLDLVELRSICEALGVGVIDLVSKWEQGISRPKRRRRR